MEKIWIILLAFTLITKVSAQNTIEVTDQILIQGLVEREVVINLDSLKKYPATHIDSIVILNHLGQRKSTLKNIQVVPVRNFLNNLTIKMESPKQLSEVYFVFIASDDYKVVFSWNEIFNNAAGNEIYVIVEKDGKKVESLQDRIAIIARSNLMTGRRYVKGLKKILVKRAE